MILEIQDLAFNSIGFIDDAKSIIWHSAYYAAGDFEIYARATENHLSLLRVGYYVVCNDDVGIIEDIKVNFTIDQGYMITATGRSVKSMLDRRLIYRLSGHQNTPTVISGEVEVAVRSLVSNNAISCADSRREIPILTLGELKGYDDIIVDANGSPSEKQVSYQNLLTYTDEILKSYGMGSRLVRRDGGFDYEIYKGADRSADNTDGNQPIIFSTDYDNLTSSTYEYGVEKHKNTALIGGAGQDLERFYELLTGGESGLDLREVFVNASSVNRTYKDGDEEKTYTDAEYSKMLRQNGKTALASQEPTETFVGDVNVSFGNWIINRDYFLGDIVTVQDNMIGKYINVRIIDVTEVWDENGYLVNVKFGE